MGATAAGSVLILDDQPEFVAPVRALLEQIGYHSLYFGTLGEAVRHLRQADPPTFILADRFLEGEPLDGGDGLEQLREAAGSAQLVVYTTVADLTREEEYDILSRGAVRIIERQTVVDLVRDIDALVRQFRELLDIREELRAATEQRAGLVAALVGSNVGVTVIDSQYQCWFANDIYEQRFAGASCCGGLCWHRFHGHPPSSGRCWGCTVSDVIESGKEVERLFLSRFANGALKWVLVRSIPILWDAEGKVVAVREGVTGKPPRSSCEASAGAPGCSRSPRA